MQSSVQTTKGRVKPNHVEGLCSCPGSLSTPLGRGREPGSPYTVQKATRLEDWKPESHGGFRRISHSCGTPVKQLILVPPAGYQFGRTAGET